MKLEKLLGLLLSLATVGGVRAADYTWSSATAGTWSNGANWSGGSAPASSTSTNVTASSYGNLQLDVSSTIGNFNLSGTSAWQWLAASGTDVTLTVSGTLNEADLGANPKQLTFSNSADGTGKLRLIINELTTQGRLFLGSNTAAAPALEEVRIGTFNLSSATGRTVSVTSATAVFGTVNFTAATTLDIYRSASGSGGVTIGSLNGIAGSKIEGSTIASSANAILTINGASGLSTFSGTISDGYVSGGGKLSVIKQGGGTQVFAGTSNYTGSTTVNAGTLLVDGVHTGAGAYAINGGTIGGIGSITTNNANFTIASGGHLAPGDSGSGVLTLALSTGVLDVSSAVSLANSGALVFDLDTVGTSDQILLSTGVLNIGSGVLELDDFAFTTTGSFAAGTYTLFDTASAITGTLGGNVSGVLGGLNVNLQFANGGQDLVLVATSAVPEPGSVSLATLGLGGVLLLFRRRKTQII